MPQHGLAGSGPPQLADPVELIPPGPAAFRQYRSVLRSGASADPGRARTLRDKMRRLKDEIAAAQKTQAEFQPQPQRHGFVWLFLRKSESSQPDKTE